MSLTYQWRYIDFFNVFRNQSNQRLYNIGIMANVRVLKFVNFKQSIFIVFTILIRPLERKPCLQKMLFQVLQNKGDVRRIQKKCLPKIFSCASSVSWKVSTFACSVFLRFTCTTSTYVVLYDCLEVRKVLWQDFQ